MDSNFRGQSRRPLSRAGGAITLRHVAEGAAVSLAYAVVVVAVLHPWFSDPARSVANMSAGSGGVEAADVNLVMWILSWDWHALTTNPLGLFDANIFHPAPNTLAASEHLLGHVAIYGPVYGLSGNPVLAYQINFLGNLVFSGAALYALLRHWGLAAGAAFFGGLLFIFFPFRIHTANYPHMFAGQYAALALLFLDRTLITSRLRDAAVFGVSLLMQMLCSYYLAYITLVATGGYALGVLWASRGRLAIRGVLLLAAAAAIAGGVFAAFSIPYLEFRSAGGIPDETDMRFLKLFSAGPWWAFLDRESPIYLGFVPFLLALVGAARASRMATRVPWVPAAALGLALACYAMAFGPDLEIGGRTVPMPYRAAMQVIPGFSSMRAPVRFLVMAQLGFAALASLGLGWCAMRLRARFGVLVAGAFGLLLAVATAAEFGLLSTTLYSRRVRTGAEIPPVYPVLAAVPRGPVLEIPSNHFYGHFRGARVASEYMRYSTFHWQRLIDGYSGYSPPSAIVTRALVAALPNEKALALLRRTTGLHYVVVHLDLLPEAVAAEWQDPAGLQLIARFDGDLLYEVNERVPPDLLADLIRLEPRSTTLTGVPLASLPDEARRANVEVTHTEDPVISSYPIGVDVVITNESNTDWPALATIGDHLVTVGYRWEAMDGSVIEEVQTASRLAYDLGPGESVRQRLPVVAPSPGEARLVVALVQDREWFAPGAPPIQLTVQHPSALAVFLPGRHGASGVW